MTKLTLDALNQCSADAFADALAGIYEHSRWIAARAAAQRPFSTVAALKQALQNIVREASADEQLRLIRAHPELAGKAALAGQLTQESSGEQARAGLHLCSADEYARLQHLNGEYNAKFGFPFILAVRGGDGRGLSRRAIIAAFERRLRNQRHDEVAECLRQIERIAELRINALLELTLSFGDAIMAWAEALAVFSDESDESDESGKGDGRQQADKEPGALTCAFMTEAHQRSAQLLADWMAAAGMQVEIDAVGNVVGRYLSDVPGARTLMTGSHYDTVRDGGKYDGRAGILLPIAVVRHLHERGEKLPFHLEVIGFSEEEGVRYRSTFLGSNAVIGQFDQALLDTLDADGVPMCEALRLAGHDVRRIAAIARDPAQLLGFVEVHIEQGPTLLERGLPVGVVSAIAGSSRFLVRLSGLASHAGTTPMGMRRDAAACAAEIVLLVEARCARAASLVGTCGQLQVPGGSVNVIAGSCHLSLDIRAADDATRLAAVADIVREMRVICERRNIELELEQTVEAPAVPCAPALMRQLTAAVERAGVPLMTLPSGAGHDAMTLARITDCAMLFTRCGNGGISHNRLETMTADDAEIAATIFLDFLRHFQA